MKLSLRLSAAIAATVALSGCAGSASPTPTATSVTPNFGTLAPVAQPTIVAPGAKDVPSTGGVRLAPTQAGVLNGKVVTLDPGHNSKFVASVNNKLIHYYNAGWRPCQSVGATAPDKKTLESALAFDIAQRAADSLRALGATVVLTRPDNDGTGPCNDERAKIADDNKSDVLISIHADTKLRGLFAHYSMTMQGGKALSDASYIAAVDIINGLRASTVIPVANHTVNKTTGVGPPAANDLGVLNTSMTTPALLVEVGNLANADDWAVIGSDAGRKSIADGIVAGSVTFLLRDKSTPTPSPTKKG